jgi:hypothetical protein
MASCGRMLFAAMLLIINGQQAVSEAATIRVIQNDRGGYIGARAIEIAAINAESTRIELRGNVCYSSCTMYLGVDDLCVSPSTSFGFHGPSRHGRALPVSEFDHWSNVMAQHYNNALKDWFLQDARHTISGYRRISGTQLIAMGYPAC